MNTTQRVYKHDNMAFSWCSFIGSQ